MRVMMRRTLVCAAILLALAHTAAAATYYVNNKLGRDAFDGLCATPGPNRAGPFATIHAATALLGAGDVMSLANTGEPYRESIFFYGVRGTPAKPIVIEGNRATITGLRRLAADRWQRQEDGSYLCPLKGRPYGFPFIVVNGHRRPAAKKEGAPDPGGCVWDAEGIRFRPEPDQGMESYSIEATLLASGLTVSNSSYILCRGLISEYHSNDGYNIHGECRGMYFENLVGRYNGDDGFSIHETVGAVVRHGHFHDNMFGVQDVNASRTILNGVRVERNKVGFSMVGGFRSMVDCVARDNAKAQITLYGNTPGHLLGSEFNPMCPCSAYLKNVFASGGQNGLELRGARAMVEHCVFTKSEVGIRVEADSVCHLTASIVANCGRLELLSRSKDFYREANVYFPGRLFWLTETYNAETWDAFRTAAGHDEHSIIADPQLVGDTPELGADSPARAAQSIQSGKYKIRAQPGFHVDSPTESLRVVARFEAEALDCRAAKVVDDPSASGGKAVEMCQQGAAVSGKVKLEPGTYAVLATAKGMDYKSSVFALILGAHKTGAACKPFSYYALRLVFDVAEAGEHTFEFGWRAGRIRLDRVTVAKVVQQP